MALDLSALTKPTAKPPQLTIAGSPGSGKTSLAALFHLPVFIQAEEVTGVFDTWSDDEKPFLMPPIPRSRLNKAGELEVSSKGAVLEQLRALATQEHGFRTVVIDTVTAMHNLFENDLCVSYKVDNVAEAAGGYGKAYIALKEMHAEVKSACDYLRSHRGMTIIFLAHTGILKMKLRPDVADEYSVYSLDMNEKSVPVYTNLVDAVIYIQQKEFITGTETNKKTGQTTKFGRISQTGERFLITSGDGRSGYVNAKNRFSLDNTIPYAQGENPLLDLIPYFNQAQA